MNNANMQDDTEEFFEVVSGEEAGGKDKEVRRCEFPKLIPDKHSNYMVEIECEHPASWIITDKAPPYTEKAFCNPCKRSLEEIAPSIKDTCTFRWLKPESATENE